MRRHPPPDRRHPTVSLHIPWDRADPAALRDKAAVLGLGFDAINSNTFADAPGQPLSYKFGSLSHTDPAVRAQAVEHNLECIEIGQAVGSNALTVWIADGSNFPGQSHLTRAFERYLEAMRAIYARSPTTGGSSPSTRCTSPPSTRRWCRTGAPTT